ALIDVTDLLADAALRAASSSRQLNSSKTPSMQTPSARLLRSDHSTGRARTQPSCKRKNEHEGVRRSALQPQFIAGMLEPPGPGVLRNGGRVDVEVGRRVCGIMPED